MECIIIFIMLSTAYGEITAPTRNESFLKAIEDFLQEELFYRRMDGRVIKSPTPAPPDPKMETSGDGPIVLPGMLEPDRGIPRHFGSEKQLHSGTGYNVVIDAEGQVYGTREPYNSEAVLQFHSRAIGEVQLKGKKSNLYLAMNEKGKVYAESDKDSENTWFKETYEDGWNRYMWLGNNKDWYLGIKKSGAMKRGPRTKKGQSAVKFVPRGAEAPNN